MNNTPNSLITEYGNMINPLATLTQGTQNQLGYAPYNSNSQLATISNQWSQFVPSKSQITSTSVPAPTPTNPAVFPHGLTTIPTVTGQTAPANTTATAAKPSNNILSEIFLDITHTINMIIGSLSKI